jgi:hypothetical protein
MGRWKGYRRGLYRVDREHGRVDNIKEINPEQ